MKNTIIILLFLVFGLIHTNHIYAKQKGRNMLSGKPAIEVHFATEGCTREVFVNGVPILSDAPKNLPFDAEAPVNEYLQSGENTISLRLTPNENQKQLTDLGQLCKGEISLQIEQIDNPKINYRIGKIQYNSKADDITKTKTNIIGSDPSIKLDSTDDFHPNKEGNVYIGPISIKQVNGEHGHGIEVQRTINIPLPFPKWKWLTSDKIANNAETKKELLEQYQKIWHALQNKKVSSLASLFNERTKELAEAYYKTEKEMSVIPGMTEAANDQKAELFGLYPKHMQLEIFGEGRLAKLVNDWYEGGTIIAFNYPDSHSHREFDITFRKQNGKWIITR